MNDFSLDNASIDGTAVEYMYMELKVVSQNAGDKLVGLVLQDYPIEDTWHRENKAKMSEHSSRTHRIQPSPEPWSMLPTTSWYPEHWHQAQRQPTKL